MCFSPVGYCQGANYDRELTIQELMQEMISCSDSTYELNNSTVYYDESNFYDFQENYKADSISFDERLTIHAHLKFIDCRFIGNYNRVIFSGINFEGGLKFIGCEVDQILTFASCSIYGLWFWQCQLNGLLVVDSDVSGGIAVDNCDLQTSSILFIRSAISDSLFSSNQFGQEDPLFWLMVSCQWNKNVGGILFQECIVSAVDPVHNIVILAGPLQSLSFDHSEYHVPVDFEGCVVSDELGGDNVIFKYPLGVELFSFPEKTTNFSWEQAGQAGIALYDNDWSNPYIAEGDSQLMNQFNYDELISAYNRFFQMYKTRGDMVSANACYIEMKDIETRRLKFLYQTEGGTTAWFNWRLNQFLRFFCFYGTSPVRALIISIWVIISFAGFYLFFYSEWDRINRKFLMDKSLNLIRYFRSDENLEQFYSQTHKEQILTFQNFKKHVDESKSEVPFFFRLFMRPLYFIGTLRYKWGQLLHRKFEILNGKWNKLSLVRKILAGSLTALVVAGYLIYLVILRGLNSVVLSINAFSTLGFGNIPVKGISRYIVILEGFTGWFLLSIFSVSLISQILQS